MMRERTLKSCICCRLLRIFFHYAIYKVGITSIRTSFIKGNTAMDFSSFGYVITLLIAFDDLVILRMIPITQLRCNRYKRDKPFLRFLVNKINCYLFPAVTHFRFINFRLSRGFVQFHPEWAVSLSESE